MAGLFLEKTASGLRFRSRPPRDAGTAPVTRRMLALPLVRSDVQPPTAGCGGKQETRGPKTPVFAPAAHT